ncbi:MAG TPA: phytanoyl-CoA dioxygenase family protein [Myxococcota bacterium]|jgi:ectoine hydroxylase-related dioxygenase (phytanoyl-CoA dioxygenase family)|nr:phytanoyl-CoA dioxygenase family protein [Myxococcota bacterium]
MAGAVVAPGFGPIERHPRNERFVWRDHRGPFRLVTPAQARAYDEQGFFVLEDALDAATLAGVEAEIDPWEEKVEGLLQRLPGKAAFIARAGEITFTIHLVLRSRVLRAFCASPPFTDLVHDLVGPDVRLYWDQAVYKKPDAEAPFPWHQDNGYTYVEPQAYLTCWIALTDATRENGCPWIAPGVHRHGTLRHRPSALGFVCAETTPPGAVAVPTRAGSIVVFSSLTPHATGPNRTSGVRKAYIVQFAPAGARTFTQTADGAWRDAPADAPDRQFPVLVGGAPVSPDGTRA